LPRELSLATDGSLRIAPLRELDTLRTDPVSLRDVRLSHPLVSHGGAVPPAGPPLLQHLADLPGESAEIRMTVTREQALRKLFGLVLFSDRKGGGLPILLRPEAGTLRVGSLEAPFRVADLSAQEDLELRIFVDKYLVEVFVNNRQAVVAAFPDYRGRLALDGFTVGAPATLKRLEIAKMKPTDAGLLAARKSRIWDPNTR
jgi:sucrose-6-phosphate hydrolase SacC (GH32 family)